MNLNNTYACQSYFFKYSYPIFFHLKAISIGGGDMWSWKCDEKNACEDVTKIWWKFGQYVKSYESICEGNLEKSNPRSEELKDF